MIEAIHRYPRTQHLEGSRLQRGDHDLTQVPLSDLRGSYCVVEEKLDGANAGISIGDDGRIRLQSRGHVLVGGAREKHWDLFKQWAHTHEAALVARIPTGATLYGEWLYAKHTIFYDELPHYFLYIKVEDPATGVVLARYKWIRASFLSSVLDSGSHWLDRPIVPNQLADSVELFA
jgi:hypothetical protein